MPRSGSLTLRGLKNFDVLDYVDVIGDVTCFQGMLQMSIKRARKAAEGEYDPGNYLPVSGKSIDDNVPGASPVYSEHKKTLICRLS